MGHLRFESKSPLNVVTQLRIQSGLSEYEAAFAVDRNLTEQGVWNQPNIDTIRSYRSSLSELATMIAKKTKTVLQDAATSVAGNLKFGSPALFALAVLGLFGSAWRPRLALDQLHLLAVLSLSVVATYFIASTSVALLPGRPYALLHLGLRGNEGIARVGAAIGVAVWLRLAPAGDLGCSSSRGSR